MFFFWFLRSFEVELAIKTDENDIFIVLCYYFKWYTVLLDVFCSPLLPRLVCGGTAIVFTVHNECDVNILTSLKSKKNFQTSAEIPFELAKAPQSIPSIQSFGRYYTFLFRIGPNDSKQQLNRVPCMCICPPMNRFNLIHSQHRVPKIDRSNP